jgi:hypothetical protein
MGSAGEVRAPNFRPCLLVFDSGKTKEVISMRYEAPSIIEHTKAINAVQDSTQKTTVPSDLSGMVTVSAYQSDEQ